MLATSMVSLSNFGGRPPFEPRLTRPAICVDGSGSVALIPLHRNVFRIFLLEYALSARTRSGLVLGGPPRLLLIEISAITAVNATESCRCPAVVTRAIGRHRESATRWIFVVTPPRERPKPSRSGTGSGRLPEFVSFDRSPRALDRLDVNLQHGRCQHVSGNVLRRLVPGTGRMMVRPDDRAIHRNRPLAGVQQVAIDPQLAQHYPPRPIP